MSSLVLEYEILPDEVKGSIIVPVDPNYVTLKDVSDHFPFVGNFAFRFKSTEGKRYVWLEITNPDSEVPVTNETVNCKVLAMPVPREQQSSKFLEADKSIETESTSDLNNVVSEVTTVVKDGLHLIGKKGSEAAKTVSKMFSSYFHKGSVPSISCLETIEILMASMQQSFDHSNETHKRMLEDLWCIVLQVENKTDKPMEMKSSSWKVLGFQRDDPLSDLRGSGVLALQSLSYMSKKYPSELLSIVESQKPRLEIHYPVAAAAINVASQLLLTFVPPASKKPLPKNKKVNIII
eukprot:TRINITY_DN3620_c0_g3_i1.p1 TRINITY_DN3620_c0_g3~~TRINITY_DN3620_c0_g3_i1.p1  ORF type:complete len:293 (-),score=66.96 TRINITY_DN3620_c0_g3_i1:34-912(-)